MPTLFADLLPRESLSRWLVPCRRVQLRASLSGRQSLSRWLVPVVGSSCGRLSAVDSLGQGGWCLSSGPVDCGSLSGGSGRQSLSKWLVPCRRVQLWASLSGGSGGQSSPRRPVRWCETLRGSPHCHIAVDDSDWTLWVLNTVMWRPPPRFESPKGSPQCDIAVVDADLTLWVLNTARSRLPRWFNVSKGSPQTSV